MKNIRIFHLKIFNFVVVKFSIYLNRRVFVMDFPFLDGEVARAPFHDDFVSQLIRFTTLCNYLANLNAHNRSLTAKLLQPGYRKAFYRNHSHLFQNTIPDLKYSC